MDHKTAQQTLRDYAEGRIDHANAGSCPDSIEGPAVRDSDCPVCQALDAFAGAVPASLEPGALLPRLRSAYDACIVSMRAAGSDTDARQRQLLISQALSDSISAEQARLSAGAAPAAVASALDVTLAEDQAGLLRDMLGDREAYAEAIPVRLLVGDGHSGHGLYVAQAEYQDEGAVLLTALPRRPRPPWKRLQPMPAMRGRPWTFWRCFSTHGSSARHATRMWMKARGSWATHSSWTE
jgi:hypothetical protein